MLPNEVPRTRMQAPRKERAHEQVDIGDDPEVLDEDVVREEDDGEIRGVPLGEDLRADEAGAEGVEKDLEGGEEDLAEDVVEADELEVGGEVGVDAVFAEVAVVLHVVALVRISERERGESSKRRVP